MNLVVGLKYPLFYGCFDTPGHYRFVSQIASLGHVPLGEYYSNAYGNNPGLHIFMGSLSIISGISVNDIFRFIIPMIWCLIPLITYFITKDIISDDLQKYTLLASGVPVATGYIVLGTNLALIPFYLLFASFIKYVTSHSKKNLFFVFFVLSALLLIISHGVTPFFFSIVLVGVWLLVLFSRKVGGKNFFNSINLSALTTACLVYVLLFWVWWANISSYNLGMLGTLFLDIFEPSKQIIPTNFYTIPFFAKIQVFSVFYTANVIFGLLAIIGLFYFLYKTRKNDFAERTKNFYQYIANFLFLIACFVTLQFVSGSNLIEYSRFIDYAMIPCIFFVGWALWGITKFFGDSFKKSKLKSSFSTIIIFTLFVACLIQFFSFQPLIPRANVLSSDLSEDQYVIDMFSVNTVYQTKMISFAEKHSKSGRIASDLVTRHQLHGFSSPSFYSRHIWFSPLEPSDEPLDWDILLLHTTKAGPLSENALFRSPEVINVLRSKTGNLVYDNGGSFIISSMIFPYFPNFEK